jgi:hypothetical protein
MIKYDAWGISKEVFDQLPNGTQIRIGDSENGTVYVVEYDKALENAIEDQIEGYERQYYIPLSSFTIKE